MEPKHLYGYCNEFGFRYNSRKIKDTTRFQLSVGRALGKRLRYVDLIKCHLWEKKKAKEKGKKYETKVAVKGTFEDMIAAAIKLKKKEEPK